MMIFDNVLSHGIPSVHKFGRNADVGQTWTDIAIGETVYQWPTEGFMIEAISTSDEDKPDGTGAWTLVVEGLEVVTWLPIEDRLTLNGTGPSAPSEKEFIRINRAFIETCGTYATTTKGSNEGDVTIRTAGDGQTHIVIDHDSPVGFGQSEVARWSVSSTSLVYLASIFAHVAQNNRADIALFQRPGGHTNGKSFTSKRLVSYIPRVKGSVPRVPNTPWGPFEPKTDLWFTARGAQDSTVVVVEYELLIVDKAE